MTTSPVTTDRPAAKHRRRPPLLVGLVMIAVVSGGYLSWRHSARSPGTSMQQPAPLVPVIATTVQERDFPIVLTGIGTVTALNTATVRSQVTGIIVDEPFKEGQFVKKGDLLAQIDPRTLAHSRAADRAGDHHHRHCSGGDGREDKHRKPAHRRRLRQRKRDRDRASRAGAARATKCRR